VGLATEIIAWTLGLAIFGAVLVVVFAALREPVRMWRKGRRRRAILVGIGVAVGLLIFWAGGQVAP
jgi:multisubunit Na+/H+ antiporter MnhB subunit